ncbi:MAG: DUF4097 family beta strand repeat protein [Clostridiales bacterium]|nr:DUF4097 family beta strand repeat protein [Clostridiales bacterium]MBO4579596.1 DUF4097 family beta strand repeat protein [Clostridiales bacterium]
MKLAKILYIISIFIITGFVILFSMGCRLGFLGSKDMRNISEKKSIEAFKNIDIDADVVNFNIEEGDGYYVKYDFPAEFKTDVSVDGDTVKAKVKAKESFSLVDFGMGAKMKKCDLTLIVPKGADLDDLKVLTKAGNINLDDLTLDEITLNCDAGNVVLDKVKSGLCNIETDAGNVQFRNCELADLKLDTDAGNVEFDNTVMKDIEIETQMGNIDLDEVRFGKGEVTTELGVIEVDGEYDKLEARSQVGAIKVKSSNEDTKFDIKTELGGVTVNGDSKGRSYSN